MTPCTLTTVSTSRKGFLRLGSDDPEQHDADELAEGGPSGSLAEHEPPVVKGPDEYLPRGLRVGRGGDLAPLDGALEQLGRLFLGRRRAGHPVVDLRELRQDTGMMMLPSALVTAALMPMVGKLTSKFDPRVSITFGSIFW